MSTELKMTINERYKYLRMMQIRYRQADKTERGLLLDEMEAMTDCHRKSLVRQMNSDLSRKKRRTQRGRTYGVEMHAALKVIAESYYLIPSPSKINPSQNSTYSLPIEMAAHQFYDKLFTLPKSGKG